MSIKNKLTVTIVFVFLIVIAILGYMYLSSMHENLVIEANDQTAERARFAANAMAQLINAKFGAVYTLADYLGETEAYGGFHDKMRNIGYLLGMSAYDYYAIQWYDKWFYISEDSYINKIPTTIYPGVSGWAVFGNLYEDETKGVLLFQDIYNIDGRVIGRVVAKLSAEAFWDSEITAIFTAEDIMVTNQSGSVLFPLQYMGGQLTDYNLGHISESNVVIGNHSERRDSLTVSVVNAQMNVTAFVNKDEIASRFKSIIIVFVVVVSASIIVVGILVYFIAFRMTRSIAKLTSYIAQMDVDCDRIPDDFTKRSDEAGKLANSFSLLLSRLNASLAETDYLAKHDSLTLLKNRYSLENDITILMKEQKSFAFALLDVDDFKIINDSKGHDEGDRLLKDLASVFRTFGTAELTAYRWGGDEFALIVYGNETSVYEAVLKQLMERVDRQFSDKAVSRITVSIGVCVFPESAVNYKDLLINADKALSFAKMGGKVNFCFYKK